MQKQIIQGVEVEAPTTFDEIAPRLVGVFACLGDGGSEEPQEKEQVFALDLTPVLQEETQLSG